jgi:HEPN domain-containing protein
MATSEAERLLRIARRDLRMARRLLDLVVEEASWGWALQQTFEKTLKAWLHHLGVKPPHSHDISRLLVLLEQTGVDIRRSRARAGSPTSASTAPPSPTSARAGSSMTLS